MRKMLILIVAVLFGILLLIGGSQALRQYFTEKAVKKTADSFIGYVVSGAGEKAYGMFSTTTQHAINQDDWDLQTTKLSDFMSPHKPVYQKITQNAGTYTVTYQITGVDGVYTWTTDLSKSSQTWQIQLFTSVRNT